MKFFATPFARTALAAAIVSLLSACGGGGSQDEPGAAQDMADGSDSLAHVAEVDIAALPEAERQALSALHPATSGAVRYIVTLNPAAVSEADVRATSALSADTPTRSRTAAAVQALSMQALSGHRATLHAQYTQALQGFAASVPEADADNFVTALASHPAVARVELDRWVAPSQDSSALAPGADGFGAELQSLYTTGLVAKAMGAEQWGLDRIDQKKLPLSGSYSNTRDGSGVTAYILDSGIKPHNEFGNRLLPGFDAIGDGNGTSDCLGHGTHVAGTVAGSTYGVAPAAQLVPVRIFGCSGGSSTSTILQGMDWILAHGVRPAVVNMSLGGPASSAMDAGAARLIAAGFTVVVAAGNANTNACNVSPARLATAITVGATSPTDARASFSNYGKCLDLFAPGTGIRSAGITGADSVATMQGTSMAAPHAAGVAALLLQERNWLLPSQVATQMNTQATAAVKGGGSGSPNKLLFGGSAALLPFNMPNNIHVAALTASGKASSTKLWAAQAAVVVRNDDNAPVQGVIVSMAHSRGAKALSCTTTAAGTCSVSLPGLSRSTAPSVSFAVTGLSKEAQTYTAQANTTSMVAATRP
jgi:subtilisin family serine protease